MLIFNVAYITDFADVHTITDFSAAVSNDDLFFSDLMVITTVAYFDSIASGAGLIMLPQLQQ